MNRVIIHTKTIKIWTGHQFYACSNMSVEGHQKRFCPMDRGDQNNNETSWINQTMGSNCSRTIDVTRWTGTQQHKCLFGGVCVPCIYHMPGGVIVGDSGLCCCVPVQCVTSIVWAQLLPIVCWVYRSALGLILFETGNKLDNERWFAWIHRSSDVHNSIKCYCWPDAY